MQQFPSKNQNNASPRVKFTIEISLSNVKILFLKLTKNLLLKCTLRISAILLNEISKRDDYLRQIACECVNHCIFIEKKKEERKEKSCDCK